MAKRKQEVLLPPARHVMPLKTLGDVLREQTRLYRAGLNRRVPLDEMTKFAYALGQIRSTVEAVAASTTIDNVVHHDITVNILPVKSATYFRPEERDIPVLEQLKPIESDENKSDLIKPELTEAEAVIDQTSDARVVRFPAMHRVLEPIDDDDPGGVA